MAKNVFVNSGTGTAALPNPLTEFKNKKSILPTFKFAGYFTEDMLIVNKKPADDKDKQPSATESIRPYHIRSVSYEQHTFKQEGQYHGPGILKTFPVLDRQENGAYRLSIVFEEDSEGTILKFIEYLKRKIISDNGLYKTIAQMKNLSFAMTIFTVPSYIITFQNVYFQTAEANDFSYGDSDMKTYTINFAYENYSIDEALTMKH